MMVPRVGTYALVMRSVTVALIRVGQRGLLQMHPGFYVYVGSAFGSGGVRARITHHQKISLRPRWHVDYLRRVTELEEVWYSYDALRREHQWAHFVKIARHAMMPMLGFGSSDCDCEAHLFFFRTRPSCSAFRRRLRAVYGEHQTVHRVTTI